MEENEILEVKMELGNGEIIQMKIQECDDWNEIKPNTKALLVLVNGQQMLIEIREADEDEGVSFCIIGEKQMYHHDSMVVHTIYVEVN
jgi:hypothetical protein